MGRVLFIVVLLVIYGSLYPFEFHARHLGASPVWLLLHSWPPAVDRSVLVDVVLNVLIYVPIGLFGSFSLGWWKTLLLALGLSSGVEMLQLFDRGRLCSTLDLISNFTGCAAGLWAAREHGRSLKRSLAEAPVRAVLRPSPALLLLACWIGYQVFPLIPSFRLYPLRVKLLQLLHLPHFPVVQMVALTFAWLAAARLVEEIGAGSGMLSLMMLTVPARLFIANRTFTWPEAAAAVCAWMLWHGWLERSKRRLGVLAWMAIAVVVLRGLAPFHWRSTASPFTWMPFAGFFDANKNWSTLVFFDKSFLYGTAVWFLSELGFPPLAAGVCIAGLLGAIEALQMHLPGRTPEITDPIWALILAIVLNLLASASRQGARGVARRNGH